MKKTFLTLAALVFAASLMNAQQGRQLPPNSFPAKFGDTYVEPQGSYTPSFKIDGKETKVKNIILLIGDGMGLGATASAFYANGGELTMTNLQTLGYVLTQSADNFTTDSAASGTAYATGVKTNNGYLGVGPDGQRLTNIPEKLAPLGYVSGVVSTDDLNGATPAAFYAHQSARGATDAIWADLPASALTFASAGTVSAFEKQPLTTQEAIKGKFTVTYSPDDAKIAGSQRLIYLPKSVQSDRGAYLPETTQMAIDYLSERSRKGFFLMVEGARIDKEEHSNKLAETVAETLDFDKAIEVAVKFAEKDGHTLVIISADHETGSVVVRKGDMQDNFVQSSFASTGHSPMMVPLYAYGPHSKDFIGYQQNSDVANKIIEILTKGKVSAK